MCEAPLSLVRIFLFDFMTHTDRSTALTGFGCACVHSTHRQDLFVPNDYQRCMSPKCRAAVDLHTSSCADMGQPIRDPRRSISYAIGICCPRWHRRSLPGDKSSNVVICCCSHPTPWPCLVLRLATQRAGLASDRPQNQEKASP